MDALRAALAQLRTVTMDSIDAGLLAVVRAHTDSIPGEVLFVLSIIAGFWLMVLCK